MGPTICLAALVLPAAFLFENANAAVAAAGSFRTAAHTLSRRAVAPRPPAMLSGWRASSAKAKAPSFQQAGVGVGAKCFSTKGRDDDDPEVKRYLESCSAVSDPTDKAPRPSAWGESPNYHPISERELSELYARIYHPSSTTEQDSPQAPPAQDETMMDVDGGAGVTTGEAKDGHHDRSALPDLTEKEEEEVKRWFASISAWRDPTDEAPYPSAETWEKYERKYPRWRDGVME